MPFTPEQHRAYRLKMKKEGMCVRCHNVKADEGKSTCSSCRKAGLARRKIRLESGTFCRYCTRQREVGNLCRVCADSKNRGRRAKRKRWIEEGRCGNCGGAMDDPTKHDCINCQLKRQYYKEMARTWI